MKKVILSLMFVISATGWARKVNIPSDGTLKLINPSAVQVTYNVTCKNATGQTVLQRTADTLAAGNSAQVGTPLGANECGANATKYAGMSPGMPAPINGMVQCSNNPTPTPSIPYTQAANLCGAGYHVCTIAEFGANRNGANMGIYGMLDPGPGQWSRYTWDPLLMQNVWRTETGTSAYFPSGSSMMGQCASGPATNSTTPSGTVVTGCDTYQSVDMMSNPMTITSAMCCSNTVGMAQCQVEITNSDPTAHLISPQFMGGKAF